MGAAGLSRTCGDSAGTPWTDMVDASSTLGAGILAHCRWCLTGARKLRRYPRLDRGVEDIFPDLCVRGGRLAPRRGQGDGARERGVRLGRARRGLSDRGRSRRQDQRHGADVRPRHRIAAGQTRGTHGPADNPAAPAGVAQHTSLITSTLRLVSTASGGRRWPHRRRADLYP